MRGPTDIVIPWHALSGAQVEARLGTDADAIEPAAWVSVVGVATSILVAIELHKLIRRRFPVVASSDSLGDGWGRTSR